MTAAPQSADSFWHRVLRLLWTRRDTFPIDTIAKLQDFLGTRASYVAQKTLYGYVKARMGTRYTAMFANADVIASLNIAKLHVFAACLSDLAIYAVGNAMHGHPVGNDERVELACLCYRQALHEIATEASAQMAQDAVAEFERRLTDVDWRKGALAPENFTASPRALFRWAPIADNLKKFDAEIIENSITFAWRDIREQFRKRIDAAAIADDWSRHTAN